MNLWSALGGWLKTIISYLTPNPPPVTVLTDDASAPKIAMASAVSAKPTIDVQATLKSYILSRTKAFGPSPTTGGIIHTIDAATADKLASLIVLYGAKYDLEPAFIAAGIAGESLYDPLAVNPNYQDAKSKNETAEDQFLHTDIGLCQFDGATLVAADGIFADLAGCTYAQIKAKAYDCDWAVDHFCAFVSKLLADTNEEVYLNPKLLDNIKANTVRDRTRTLAVEAYNSGETGAEALAKSGTDLSYGERWMQTYATISLLLSA
jgi:hypothetical protein